MIEQMKASPDGDAWDRFERMYSRLVSACLIQEGADSRDADETCGQVIAALIASIRESDDDQITCAIGRRLRRITATELKQLWDRKTSDQRKEASTNLLAIADQLSDDRSRTSRAWDRQHDTFVLHEMLDHLNDRFSERSMTAFRRVAVGQEDASKVAGELGLSLGALRVAQHRVLRALREATLGVVDETA